MVRAQSAYESGEIRTAIIDLKELLKRDSNNPQARALLGRVYLLAGDHAAAEIEFQRAMDLGASQDEMVPALADTLIRQGKYESVIDLVPSFDMSATSAARLRALRASAYMALEQPVQATEELEVALSLGQELAEVQVAKAAVTSEMDLSAAREIMEQVVADAPDYMPAWILKAKVDFYLGHYQESVDAYSRAIELGGDSFVLHRARALVQLGDFDKAQKDLKKAKAELGDYFEIPFLKGLIELKKGNLAEAQANLDLAYGMNKFFLPTKIYLAELNYKLGNLAQAKNFAAEYMAEQGNYLPAIVLYASILSAGREYEEAIDVLDSALSKSWEGSPNAAAALKALLADAQRGAGNVEKELTILRELGAEQMSPSVRYRLAVAEIEAGDKKKGEKELEAIVQDEPANFPAVKELVEHLSKEGQHDKALRFASAYASEYQVAQGHLLLGLAYAAKGDMSSAKAAFTEAKHLAPADMTINFNLALLARNDGDLKAASGYYSDVIKGQPENIEAYIRLADVSLQMGSPEEFVKFLQKAISIDESAKLPRLKLAEHYLNKDELNQALSLVEPMYTSDPDDISVVKVLGRLRLKFAAYRDADNLFTQWVEATPKDALAHFWLSQSKGLLGDLKAAKKSLEKAISLNDRFALAYLNLAQLYLRENDLSSGKKLMLKLDSLVPENEPDLVFLKATLARLEGRQEEALKLYRQVNEAQPTSKSQIAVAQQLWNMEEREQATGHLRNWLEKHPEDATVAAYLANLYALGDRAAESIAVYKTLLKSYPDNVLALNNLAWALRNEDRRAALSFSRRAYELQPNSIAVGDTLTQLLLDDGQMDEALKVSSAMVVGLTPSEGNAESFLLRADILLKSGKKVEARRVLNELLSSVPSFSGRSKAESMLSGL